MIAVKFFDNYLKGITVNRLRPFSIPIITSAYEYCQTRFPNSGWRKGEYK